ncbi:13835_t:CDS:2, partial [Dentiscutata heterogama]
TMMENIDYNDSDSESVDEIENFSILNFNNDTYQNIKDKILQLDGDDNKDYNFNSEIEEIILHDELDEGFDKIIPNIPENKDNKYTSCSTWEIDQCYEADSSHLHRRYSKGTRETDYNEKHDDLTRVLETFGNWIQLVAKSDNIIQKQQLIWLLLLAVESLKPYLPQELLYKPINPDPSKRFVMPTLLITQIAFQLAKIDLSIKAKAASLKENDDIHQKVIETVEIGCKFDKSKIVILKPGPAPNSNKNAYKTCDIFLNDVANTGVNIINIACDEAIFRRLKNYENKDLTVNIILEQWHTSKDMYQALLAAFSVIDIDDHVVPNRLKQTWALSEQIYNAFQNPDPNSHSLFDYTTQNTTKEFFNMETCYQHGIERMQNLLVEEVYLTKKKKSKGRGIKNLVKDSVAALKQRKKKQKNTQNEDNTQSEDNAQNDNDTQYEDE